MDDLWVCPVCGQSFVARNMPHSELRGRLAEAYEVGAQRHVNDPGWHRQREPPEWVRPAAG
jgi:hypothetical protein